LNAIETHELTRKFGERTAVENLTLGIPEGSVFGFLGPNGAGKTTTVRMLAALIAPTGGTAQVAGHELGAGNADIRRSVGILTETPGLYGTLTATQNLVFFGGLYGLSDERAVAQAERYLKMLEIWDRRDDKVGGFSKGMRQKLALVRALLHEPPFLILDEPTSALDAEGAKLVRDFIASLKGEGRTILLCTHNLFEAQSLCDRVAIIKGTLLRMGTPRELQMLLYNRQVEVRLDLRGGQRTAEQLVEVAASIDGVGDVEVEGDRMLVSVTDPDEVTPMLVDGLVAAGARILRVAEIEHTLEKAYLDVVTSHAASRNGAQPEYAEAVA
jgi:ABC-2 type transport system ATP-binding protein